MTAEKLHHLQIVRSNIPEPTRVEASAIEFTWDGEVPVVGTSIGRINRRLFIEGTTKFWAWTYDGKTPLFPGL